MAHVPGRGGNGGYRGRGRGGNNGSEESSSGHQSHGQGQGRGGAGGGRGRGRGMTDEQKASILGCTRAATIQVSSEGTDDVIIAAPVTDGIRHNAIMVLTKDDFGAFQGQKQVLNFVNSCLINLSNHHTVDTTGILTDLASRKGRERLTEILTKTMNVDNNADFKSMTLSFQYIVLPFIGVLTRESVCQSTLTTASAAIYSTVYLYRGEFLDEGVLTCMDTLLTRGSMKDYARAGIVFARDQTICHVDSFPRALLAITRLFYQLVKRIQDSKVTLKNSIQRLQQLQTKCQGASSGTEEDRFLNEVLAQEVRRLQRMVSDAQDMLIAPMNPNDFLRTTHSSKNHGTNMVHLARVYDPPGALSPEGPRHDNDHQEIKDIKVLPTQNEITAARAPFLPANGIPDAPHFLQPGWKRQLDVHFRLYREDMLDSLRKGVISFLNVLERIDKKNEEKLLRQRDLKKLLQDGVSLNVYGNVRFLGIDCSKGLGGSVQITFNQPPHLVGTPLKKRSDFWERSKRRLMQGALICIASRSTLNQNDAGHATPAFQMALGVVTRRDVPTMAKDEKVASIHVQLTDLKLYLDMLSSQTQMGDQEQWYLVESTGAFYESYRPILAALQKCEPASLPFGKYIAPTKEESAAMIHRVVVDPPIYARAPGFRFDLSVVMGGQPLRLDANNRQSATDAIAALQRRSYLTDTKSKPLDETQAKALVETLCREVSLISGPPGTGKTKIGVDLMRVLLHNKQAMNCGPILCICYTNHALDQFLEHLIGEGVTDIVRVGARSKTESLDDYNLESLMGSREKPFSVRAALRMARNEWEAVTKRIQELEKAFRSDYPTWEFVQPFLMMNNAEQCMELETGRSRYADYEDDDEDDGFQTVGHRDMSPYERWAECIDIKDKERSNRWVLENQKIQREQRNGRQERDNRAGLNMFDALSDRGNEAGDTRGSQTHHEDKEEERVDLQYIPDTDRPLVNLQDDVWLMSRSERQRLIDSWRPQILGYMMDEMKRLIQQLENAKQAENDARDDFRRTILRQTSVIGMTTNGAAKHQTLVAAVAPKIIMCEEAGEVLESHILATLSLSTQHLILIGDHLQLRPHVETNDLSTDSKVGKNYNLDLSLFERLVKAKPALDLSKLTVQRRMRPEISSIIRNMLYPELVDGDNVKVYPPVQGMGANLFFMDHSHPEDSQDEYGLQSYSNSFEVGMVEALANYLIKNGYDQPGDIAVITPYLGQLSKLRDRMKKSFMLVIDERDQEQLDQKEVENEDGPAAANSNINEQVGVRNISLQKYLTLRTIDNYQGEEAKIVIITLVRSDVKQDGALAASSSIGFLRSPNRTNVLLSRAQHGMFIIGNAGLMSKERHEKWPKIIEELRRNDRLGEGLPIVCQNHPNVTNIISDPETFKIMAPNGGCLAPCGRVMPCGHTCPLSCHPDDKGHQLVKCYAPCPRLQPGCDHVCPKMCGEKCGDCMEHVDPIVLPCRHVYERPRCHQAKNPSKIVCRKKITRKLPTCEHEHEMECFQDPAKLRCGSPCGALLPCGDTCRRQCDECQRASSGGRRREDQVEIIARTVHGKCTKPCGRIHFCGHSCSSSCHEGSPCPPCAQKCAVACSHFVCHLKCETACAACCDSCVWECPHEGRCPVPCGAPCNRLPCNKRCEKELSCGHRCPSVCGEKCPPKRFCVECKDPTTMNTVVDLVMGESLGDIDVDEDPLIVMGCGHALTMSSLDGMMEMNQYYEEQLNKRTGEVRFVAMKALPDGEISQVPCHLCRKPIVDLFRYGRRIKYGQLSMRLKKIQILQDKEMKGALQRLDVAQARMAQEEDAFLRAIDALPDELRTVPPNTAQRKLGKFAKKDDPFPQVPFKSLHQPYGIPVAHEALWSKLIKSAVESYMELRKINLNSLRSPSKQLFDATVVHLYRAKTAQTFDVASNTMTQPLLPSEDATPSEIIEACIKECGLPRGGHGGAAFVNSLHGCTNVLILLLTQAFSVASKMDTMSGWFWFVEDLLECTLVHAEMLLENAEQGRFDRQAAYARVTRMDVLCKMTRLMGRKPLPTDGAELRERRRKVDELTEKFHSDLHEINTRCPLGIKEECIQRATAMEEQMVVAIGVARGEAPYVPLTREEKVMLFNAMNTELSGSGHWYHCVNGHGYVIGECGMAMEESRCPECGERVGGGHHTLLADNAQNLEFEEMYREQQQQRGLFGGGFR